MSKTVETGRRKFIRDAGKTANENVDACQEADKIQRRFFKSYVTPWIDVFFQRVERMKPQMFYASVLSLSKQFMEQEKVVMAEAD